MEVSNKFLNVSQLLINSLKEGINLERYYCFKSEEAKHLLRVLDLFYTGKNVISVSFFNNPAKDQTIAIKIFEGHYFNKTNIEYLDSEVENYLKNIKIGKTPIEFRELINTNF